MGYSFRLTARVLLYAPSHRQDSTYHGLWYTSHGALAGTRNISMGPPHEGSTRRPIALWANALTTELHLAPAQWVHHEGSIHIRQCTHPVPMIFGRCETKHSHMYMLYGEFGRKPLQLTISWHTVCFWTHLSTAECSKLSVHIYHLLFHADIQRAIKHK